MAAIPGVAIATQIAMRTGNGKSTAARIIPVIAASQAPAARPPAREGSISICPQQGAAQGRESGLGGNLTRNQIADQVRIGQLEKLLEGGLFITRRL
jgi:hypothetical protein